LTPLQVYQPVEDNKQPFDVKVQLQYGESVHQRLQEFCGFVSEEICIDTMDALSFKTYPTVAQYTPSRPTSNLEDFTATRSDVVNYLQQRYFLKSYLEIGCQYNQTFDLVHSYFEVAICVDPEKGGTHRMTSNEFFLTNTQMFDLIFIDGLHEGNQVSGVICLPLIQKVILTLLHQFRFGLTFTLRFDTFLHME
jgi:hypothetical protein